MARKLPICRWVVQKFFGMVRPPILILGGGGKFSSLPHFYALAILWVGGLKKKVTLRVGGLEIIAILQVNAPPPTNFFSGIVLI